jgi:hypothetical protein
LSRRLDDGNTKGNPATSTNGVHSVAIWRISSASYRRAWSWQYLASAYDESDYAKS